MENDVKKIYKEYKTRESGLTQEEVKERLISNGKNVFAVGKQKSVWLILLNQFKSAIIVILFVAIALSLIIAEYENIVFIGAVIVINTVIGFVQEYRAERSAQRLKMHIKIQVKVIRDNNYEMVDSEDLVVGDLVCLETGNKIPADIKLIETKNFKVDESILTGESEGVVKREDFSDCDNGLFKNNIAYAGTIVLMGRAIGVVVKTGQDTEYGKIAGKIVSIKSKQSPLTIRINKFSKQISIAFTIIAVALAGILYFKGYDWYNIFFSVVALVVSAIPEGLTTGMTICLSLSSSKMAKKNVIVKQLSAVEGLSSCNIIASDKTGTLTVNEQTAKRIVLPNDLIIPVSGSGYNQIGELEFDKNDEVTKNHIDLITELGYFNNESMVKITSKELLTGGDSIDIAFKVLALKNKLNTSIDVLQQIPYESELKYSALSYEKDGEKFLTIKGAVSEVVKHCNTMLMNGKEVKIDYDKIENQNTQLASDGFRVIALCYGKIKNEDINTQSIGEINNLTFVGLVGFVDPIRDDTKIAIDKCHKTGIKVVMITGDHKLTALYIAKQLGIAESSEQLLTGEDLERIQKKGNDEFDKAIKNINVFARVSPMQKHAIVESYKRQGLFVAVTGDGVNDVLALKDAHIGISVGSGADIAKDTADMIIADDKFSSIVTGIDEGKRAYGNVRNIIYLLMSTGICEVMLYLLSVLCNLSFPLTGVQFLWLNLVTNGIQSNVFAFEKNVLVSYNNKVKNPNENIFNKLMITECLVSTLLIGLSGFALYYILLKNGMDINMARTYLLTHMVFFESMQAFNCRNEYVSAFKCKFTNNPALVLTIIASFVFQIVALYIVPIAGFIDMVPIKFTHVLLLVLASLSQIVLMEIFKYFLRKKCGKNN